MNMQKFVVIANQSFGCTLLVRKGEMRFKWFQYSVAPRRV